jgi:hypothetical protein
MTAKKKRARTIDTAGYNIQIYPFDDLKVGESFIVKDLAKWASVRTRASRKGAALGRTFKVTHEGKLLRISRVA